MLAGKTTWLISYVSSLPPKTCKLFKPDIDTRFAEDKWISHDGKQLQL